MEPSSDFPDSSITTSTTVRFHPNIPVDLPSPHGSMGSTNLCVPWRTRLSAALQPTEKIGTVAAFTECFGEFSERRCGNEAHSPRYLLNAGDFQTLTFLDCMDEFTCLLKERVMRSGIQPSIPAPESLHLKLLPLQIDSVDIGNLEFASRRRLYVSGHLNHIRVVEIESRDRPIGYRLGGFFDNRCRNVIRVEAHNTVALGIANLIGKDRGSRLPFGSLLKRFGQAMAVENVVAENKGTRIFTDKILRNQERLSNPLWLGLGGIFEPNAPLAAIPKKALESRLILRGCDHKKLPIPASIRVLNG